MSTDNNTTDKKRGFSIQFVFATINRCITMAREIYKARLTGMNIQSDNFSLVDTYVGTFRAPFCPNHGNFPPRLSTYIQKYQNNSTMLRYMFIEGSILAAAISVACVSIGIALKFILHMEWKNAIYLMGIVPIIYSFFINSFCTVLLNVHGKYLGSSSAVIVGNIFSMASVGIPYIFKIMGFSIEGFTLISSLILMNLTYSFIQSIYILIMSKELLQASNAYTISEEDRKNTRDMQIDILKMLAYQSPKPLTETCIKYFVRTVKASIISIVTYSHKIATTIMLCVVQPLHHMSYKILNQLKNEKEFQENSGDLFTMLHICIVPFLLIISNTKLLHYTLLFFRVIPENSDTNEFIKIFQAVFFSTYCSSLSRLLKNIISLSTQSKTLAISSISGATIPGSIVIMHIISKKYSIQTTYINTEVLGNMLKYCLSIGDVIEFIYLMINTFKNKSIKFSTNQLIIILTTIISCFITLLTDINMGSTLLLSIIFLIAAVYNCIKYLNKR